MIWNCSANTWAWTCALCSWYQNKKFNDGDSDFEKKIAELNIRSNNAGVVKIYSLGIDRKKTENGIEDTLNLVIPPSKSIKRK